MAIHSQAPLGFPFQRAIKGRDYRVELAKRADHLDQAFALRYQVFNLELGEGLRSSEASQRDRDAYDEYCDHLVVIDEATDQVVANYRLLPYARARAHIGFYSETEFQLAKIDQHLVQAAELGRCCVHHRYRDGAAMNLLWQGLSMYMEANSLLHLFGCASLAKGESAKVASQIYAVFKAQNAIAPPDFRVQPKAGLEVQGFQSDEHLPEGFAYPKRLLPALIRGYLMLGAKLCGDPAYDAEFDVIDFFTIFDYTALTKVVQKFLPDRAS